ncbi:hypothetical protein LguiA_027915 [Lonicera macranthoides]
MMGNQLPGDGLSSNLSGLSKPQLYDIMSQLKTLVDQNQDQAKEILVQNPALTRALFQAQIMLGMVQPPSVIPNIQPAASKQSAQTMQPSNSQVAPSLAAPIGVVDQISGSQLPTPIRKQQKNQPPIDVQTPSLPKNPLQSKGHHNAQASSMSLPQFQVPNTPPVHSVSQAPSIIQPARHAASTQSQQPLQTSGITHMPSQPPLPPQPRPPPMPAFPHQLHPQMGTNASFQHSSAPQLHHLQPIFQQGGGSQMGMGFGQVGSSSSLGERVVSSAWMPETTAPTPFSGSPPSSFIPGLMGPGNQSAGPPSQLTADMEKALLQQVMSLGPEQVNMLPPEQRNQVLQLQRILRQQQ